MSMRKVKDAKDLTTNELIYFKGHAKATYMSDGRSVEDAINEIPEGGGGGGSVGPQGPAGEDGKDGVSITSVVQTTTSTADGGNNVVTVTLSDGKTSTFTVKNGSKGSQGEKGDQGEQGIQGPKGDKGDQGPSGTNGTNGKDGENGATFTPSVDANGNLSWTNDKGLANPATINIKGPKGDKGDSGSGGGGSSSGSQKEIVIAEVREGSLVFTEGRNLPFEPDKIYIAEDVVTDNFFIGSVVPPTSYYGEYNVCFSVGVKSVLSPEIIFDLPSEWVFANGNIPAIEEGVYYELSVVATKQGNSFIYKAVLTPFKPIE